MSNINRVQKTPKVVKILASKCNINAQCLWVFDNRSWLQHISWQLQTTKETWLQWKSTVKIPPVEAPWQPPLRLCHPHSLDPAPFQSQGKMAGGSCWALLIAFSLLWAAVASSFIASSGSDSQVRCPNCGHPAPPGQLQDKGTKVDCRVPYHSFLLCYTMHNNYSQRCG